jgi:hypothetical protein
VRSLFVFTNFCSNNGGATVDVSSVQQCADVLKVLKQDEQQFMTGCRMVTVAL